LAQKISDLLTIGGIIGQGISRAADDLTTLDKERQDAESQLKDAKKLEDSQRQQLENLKNQINAWQQELEQDSFSFLIC
jgi:chromosome segregation ATPase